MGWVDIQLGRDTDHEIPEWERPIGEQGSQNFC